MKMKNSMKLFAPVAFAAVLGVAPAFAQTPTTIKSDIPFDFSVRGKVLPAGQYMITERTASSAILIRNTNGEESVFVLAGLTSKKAGDEDTTVTFHVVGDHYYLAGFKVAGDTYGRELVKSAAERETESAGLRPVLASIKAVRQ
jgi:hypothetical protein